MPLETAQFIHQLDAANPLGSDPIASGDDHLRLIKSAIKATFPNITGAVNISHTDLNNKVSNSLQTTGGTMTGALVLSGDPTVALNPATKQYAENASNLSTGTVPTGRLTGTYNINITGNAATATNGVPAGAVMVFAMNSAPSGWLACNGAQVSRTEYAALFAAIGTTYGAGNGVNTFNLPDLRGEFVRGVDNGRGVDSGRGFASFQGDAIRNITGFFNKIRVKLNNDFSAGGAIAGSLGEVSGDANLGSAQTANLDFNASRVVPTANENRPRNVAMLYCIKA